MANLQSLTDIDTGNLTLPSGTTAQRPSYTTTIVRWTNTGTQAVSTLAGSATTTSNSWTCPTGITQIEVLVVAGGGGGGGHAASDKGGAGGGAGGLVYNSCYQVIPGNTYSVTVGAGGSAGTAGGGNGGTGSNSIFDLITAYGGGGGYGGVGGGPYNGLSGGSGGGAMSAGSIGGVGGAGTAGQGWKGGDSTGLNNGCGGGGAGGPGGNNTGSTGGIGGVGLAYNISGTTTYYAGGGGGAAYSGTAGAGGLGGGGAGQQNANGTSGTASTGGGGGGGGGGASSTTYTGGAGGSGVVIIRYNLTTTTVEPIGHMRHNSSVGAFEFFSNNNQWSTDADVVLYLDAGNSNSYSGSGTTWTDLSRYGNNATLISSPTYSSSNNGYFTFNGSSQYAVTTTLVDFTLPVFGQGFTMEAWVYPTSSNTRNIIFSTAYSTSGTQWQNYMWYDTTSTLVTPNVFGSCQRFSGNQNDFTSPQAFPINNWYHVVVSSNNTTSTIYVNGNLIRSNFTGQPDNTNGSNSNSMESRIGAFKGYNYFTGNIAMVRIYSRGINNNEVTQNFNTFRGRYGI